MGVFPDWIVGSFWKLGQLALQGNAAEIIPPQPTRKILLRRCGSAHASERESY